MLPSGKVPDSVKTLFLAPMLYVTCFSMDDTQCYDFVFCKHTSTQPRPYPELTPSAMADERDMKETMEKYKYLLLHDRHGYSGSPYKI